MIEYEIVTRNRLRRCGPRFVRPRPGEYHGWLHGGRAVRGPLRFGFPPRCASRRRRAPGSALRRHYVRLGPYVQRPPRSRGATGRCRSGGGGGSWGASACRAPGRRTGRSWRPSLRSALDRAAPVPGGSAMRSRRLAAWLSNRCHAPAVRTSPGRAFRRAAARRRRVRVCRGAARGCRGRLRRLRPGCV